MHRVSVLIRVPHAAIRVAAAAMLIATGCSSTGPRDTGSLTITVSGLAGAPAAITVTGPSGYHETVTVTTTLSHLMPGAYTINAANVVVSGITYGGTPSSTSVMVSSQVPGATAVAYLPTLTISSGALPSGEVGVTYGVVEVTRGEPVECATASVGSCTPCSLGGANPQDLPACPALPECIFQPASTRGSLLNPPCLWSSPFGRFSGYAFVGGGGAPPYAWTWSPIPGGLSLDPSTGEIIGTPTTAGSYSILVKMADSATPPDSTNVTLPLTIAP